jgi:RNA polymerase sigma-70 factor, ECF subfamily
LGRSEHEQRFQQWLADHAGLLLKVVRSFTKGPVDGDDLLQEILLQVWMSLPSFREQSKPTTWLYRVALNTALGWKRQESRRRRAIPLDVQQEIAAECGEDSSRQESLEQLYGAIRRLEPAKRALVLLYLDGLSYADMAEVTGISESNVGVRLNRIKKELTALLKAPTHVA